VIHCKQIGVERASVVIAVARWEEATKPDVQHGRCVEFSHCVQYLHVVGYTAVIRIHHGADVFGDVTAEIETQVVQLELIDIGGAICIGMHVTRLYSCPNSKRGIEYLRSQRRRGEQQKTSQAQGYKSLKNKNAYGSNTTRQHKSASQSVRLAKHRGVFWGEKQNVLSGEADTNLEMSECVELRGGHIY
jgi:hypothetical protein